jgi:hypothetical protein
MFNEMVKIVTKQNDLNFDRRKTLLKSSIIFKDRIVDGHIEFPYCMLLFASLKLQSRDQNLKNEYLLGKVPSIFGYVLIWGKLIIHCSLFPNLKICIYLFVLYCNLFIKCINKFKLIPRQVRPSRERLNPSLHWQTLLPLSFLHIWSQPPFDWRQGLETAK